MLVLNANHDIGKDQKLYSMLTNPSSNLEKLYLTYASLSSREARKLFTAIMDNNQLKYLNISINFITEDACDVITSALQRNSCLVELIMHSNPLSGEAIINIARCLEVNNTLQLLQLSCPNAIQEKIRIRSLQEVINKKREG